MTGAVPSIDLRHFHFPAPDLATAWASDLGWKPGQWPTAFAVTYPGLPSEHATFLANEYDREGDLEAVTYQARGGATYRIFND